MLRNLRSSLAVATLVVAASLSGCATTRVEPLPAIGLPVHSAVATIGRADVAPSFPTAAGEAGSTLAQAPLALLKAGPFAVAAVFMMPYIVASVAKDRISCLNSRIGDDADAPSRVVAAVRANVSGDRLSEVLKAQLVARGDAAATVIGSADGSAVRRETALDRASRDGVEVLFELSDPEAAFRLEDQGCALVLVVGLNVHVTRLRDGVVLADGHVTGKAWPSSDPVSQWRDDPQALSDVVDRAFGDALEGVWQGTLGKRFDVVAKASGGE
jgi:hypothetical protein